MCSLYYPTSCFVPWRFDLGVGFLTASFQILLVVMLARRSLRRVADVSGIHAESLRRRIGRIWPCAYDLLQGGLEKFDIMHVGSAGDQRQRDPTGVHQQAAFASIFSPDPWGSDPRIAVPTALCAWLRRCFASARQCPPSRRTRPILPATNGEKNRPYASAESAHEPRWRCRTHRARPSIGSPYAIHKRWRKTLAGRASEAVRRQVYADTDVLPDESQRAQAVPPWPKTNQKRSTISRKYLNIYLRISSKPKSGRLCARR